MDKRGGKRQDKLSPKDYKSVRMEGETGCYHNQLRYELYKEVNERIKDGLEKGKYFEVISLTESIMTDRVNCLIERIINEDNACTDSGVGKMISLLSVELSQRDIKLPKELRTLLYQVINQQWLPKRNYCAHSFVVITNENVVDDVETRLKKIEDCAREGAFICRTLTDEVRIYLRDRYNEMFKETEPPTELETEQSESYNHQMMGLIPSE
tara:strand:- start:789 stop:1421 length:633 start_codon:yes stop_codon:yes gene_type:complete